MLTATGFIRKRYDDFIEEMQQQARELFGVDVNLEDHSPMGQWIKLLAYQRAEENELAEAVWNSGYVDTAEGVNLDNAVKYKGITRFPKRKSNGFVRLKVDPNITIESGMLVGTTDGFEFVTMISYVVADWEEYVDVPIEAVRAGSAGNVPPNTITEILTPVAGVESVTNPEPTKDGQEAETDTELRQRYHATSGESGTIDGITSKILNNVVGVRGVVGFENVNDVVDEDERPPHSFECIVLGGNREDIAKTIFQAKPGGIRSYGSEQIFVQDISGNHHLVGFSYATEKQIYVRGTVKVNAAFPTNGVDMIKLDIIKYIGGSDQNNNFYAGLSMAQTVVLGKISNVAFSTPGVDDAFFELSLDGVNYSQENITIGKIEVAETTFDKLVINIE